MEMIEVYINRYKNKILNVLIVAVALFTAFNIYKDQAKAIQSLTGKKQKEIEKNEILDTISRMDKKIRAYRNFLNKKDISLVIDNLGNIAENSNVKISSIKPDLEQVYPLYVKYAFNIGLTVNNYNTLGKFISKLEKSDDVYMIEGLSVLPNYMFSKEKESELKGLVVNMKVCTFLLRD